MISSDGSYGVFQKVGSYASYVKPMGPMFAGDHYSEIVAWAILRRSWEDGRMRGSLW